MSSSSSPRNDDMVSVSQTFSPISESLQSPMIPSGENQSNTSSSPINSEQVEANDGGRNTIKSEIFKIYNCEKEKVMKKLDKNRGRVAITTDMWTSSNKKRGFMVVTAYFVDDSWNLHSQVMRFIYVPSLHTKEVLADSLLDCLLEWNIDRKLSTMTMDNCSTNDAMVQILWERL
ncbi:hypothetical protein AAC387_Pa10g1904 [Persea americana]